MNYKDELTNAMKLLMDKPETVFIGQQIVYYGNPMSKTIEGLPKERMIETPVMEETQMGMTLGMAMAGKLVVSFYPRWDFLISAMNQLVNHLDKYELMTSKKVHVIVRVGKGSDKPLDPGHQHKANYIKPFGEMLKTVTLLDCTTAESVRDNYNLAINTPGVYIINEYPELY